MSYPASPPQGVITNALAAGALSIKIDGSGNLGFFRGATEIAFINGAANQFNILAAGALIISTTAGLSFVSPTAQLTGSFRNIATAGLGVPIIYAAGPQTLYTNAAPTALSYTPAASAGMYRLHGMLNVLTGGTLTFRVKITYKDPGGNAITDIPVFTQQNSATLLAGGPTANTTGRFFFSHDFAIDNSATAITIVDNAGTYTAGTYYWVPVLEQLA